MRMSSMSDISFVPKGVSHNYALNQHIGNQGTVSSNFMIESCFHTFL